MVFIYCTWFFKTLFFVIILVMNEIAQNEDEIDIITENEKNNFAHGSKLVYLIYNYKHGVCACICLSVFYLSFIYFLFSDVISLSLPLWRNPIGYRSLWSVLGGGRRESPVKHRAGGASRGGGGSTGGGGE
jgi:uncharacterized membrane protein YgcG